MKKKCLDKIIAILVLAFSLFSLILGISITTHNVKGVNITNETVLTHTFIWNTEPQLYKVEISPSPIDLTPGNTTRVNCTAYYYDYSGWQDVANGTVNATLYDISHGYNHTSPDDNNYHYTNSSCNVCYPISGSNGLNGTCTCFFSVWYYANNATWQCNISVADSGGNATEREHNLSASVSLTANATINTLIGINLPPEIDYGNLSVTEISNDVTENVTNWGNIPINISVRGYGGDDESLYGNLSMVCQLGNISVGYEKYSMLPGENYDAMINLTHNNTPISGLTLYQRTNDTSMVLGDDVNQTFWKLKIPLSVGGQCNGTVVFNAIDANQMSK